MMSYLESLQGEFLHWDSPVAGIEPNIAQTDPLHYTSDEATRCPGVS